MLTILVAIGWFVFLAGLANILQYVYGVTYQKNWRVFVTLFLGFGVPGIYVTTGLSSSEQLHNPIGIIIGCVSTATFLIIETWWSKHYVLNDMYRSDTLPISYHQLLAPNLGSALSKTSEIFIQDIVMLVVVTELLRFNISLGLAGLLFAVLVFLMHIPSPKILGRFYGVFLMLLATVIAPVIPFFMSKVELGFYLIFTFHLSVYVCLLVGSRLLQKRSR
jgi:hypothetical protein